MDARLSFTYYSVHFYLITKPLQHHTYATCAAATLIIILFCTFISTFITVYSRYTQKNSCLNEHWYWNLLTHTDHCFIFYLGEVRALLDTSTLSTHAFLSHLHNKHRPSTPSRTSSSNMGIILFSGWPTTMRAHQLLLELHVANITHTYATKFCGSTCFHTELSHTQSWENPWSFSELASHNLTIRHTQHVSQAFTHSSVVPTSCWPSPTSSYVASVLQLSRRLFNAPACAYWGIMRSKIKSPTALLNLQNSAATATLILIRRTPKQNNAP